MKKLPRDAERIERIRHALLTEGLDAIVCALPSNVLLLTGYWPVIGNSIAIATREGEIALLAPEDERELAERGWADELKVFQSSSLEKLTTALEGVRQPFSELSKKLRLENAAIGFEYGAFFQPAPYVSAHFFGMTMLDLLLPILPNAKISAADSLLARLRAALTPMEIERLRRACEIAATAFRTGRQKLKASLTEREATALFQSPLHSASLGEHARVGGSVWCMSGPNSAEAYAAFQRSCDRRLADGDLALVHCNSQADGFWTDITRTFCLGKLDERKEKMYAALFEAHRAALAAVKPGVKAREVDRAARETLAARGFGKEFKHPTGHGVGFAAINHNALPRLHPASDDVLETGMTFNVEPGIYFPDYGGMRHCDTVMVTEKGAEVLTDFFADVNKLTIAS